MKNFVKLLCAAALLVAVMCLPAFAIITPEEPEQDEDGYYLIGTTEEFFWYLDSIKDKNNMINAKLTADININPGYKVQEDRTVTKEDGSRIPGVTFTVLDSGCVKYRISENEAGWEFMEEFVFWNTPIDSYVNGVFDGQNHTISGMYCANDAEMMTAQFGMGLFATVNGTVKNLGIVDGYICCYLDGDSAPVGYIGTICSNNYGIIDNCYSDIDIDGGEWLGGIASHNFGIIKNCYNTGNIRVWSYSDVGGICGVNIANATIENCYNAGKITGDASGGICGENRGYVYNSYNAEQGSVTCLSGSGAITSYNTGVLDSCYNEGMFGNGYGGSSAGICGTNMGTITKCYNTYSGTATNGDGFLSGIVYENSGTVSMCYNTGSFSGGVRNAGICGLNNVKGIIENCYNTGTINGTHMKNAGICAESKGTVRNCYNMGSITGRYYTGAIVGYKVSGTVDNCYYLAGCAKDTTNKAQNGIGNATAGSSTSDTSSYTQSMTVGDFSSGKVCYLLRTSGTVSGDWRQTLPEQLRPCFDGKVVEYKPEFDLYYNSTEGITIAGNKAELVVTGNLVQANKIAIPGVLVIASYTRAGQFVDVVFIPIYQDADITIPSTGLDTSGASKITAMLWTSVDVPAPMCEAKSANL